MSRTALLALSLLTVAAPAWAQDAPLLEKAKAQLETTVRQFPSDTRAHLLLARTYAMTGDSSQALEHFRIAAAAADPAALLEEADTFYYRNEFADAREAFQNALTAAKKAGDVSLQIDAELGIARADLDLGHYGACLDRLEKLEDSPPKPLSARQKAKLFTDKGGAQGFKSKKEGLMAMITIGPRVRGTLEKAMAADPEYPRAVYALGRYFIEAPGPLADSGKGGQLLAKAVKMRRSDLTVRAWYIRSLHVLGKETEEQSELASFQKDFGSLPAARKFYERLKERKAPN